jgi:hypothetical protein
MLRTWRKKVFETGQGTRRAVELRCGLSPQSGPNYINVSSTDGIRKDAIFENLFFQSLRATAILAEPTHAATSEVYASFAAAEGHEEFFARTAHALGLRVRLGSGSAVAGARGAVSFS